MHIAYKLSLGISVHADIYDNGALFNHAAVNKLASADCNNQNIGIFRDFGKIFCFGMANSDRAVLLKKEHAHRLAYNIASADYDAVFAGNVNFILRQKLHNAGGSARQKIVVAYHNMADIFGVKGVNIFVGADGVYNGFFVNVLRERKLNQKSGYAVIIV